MLFTFLWKHRNKSWDTSLKGTIMHYSSLPGNRLLYITLALAFKGNSGKETVLYFYLQKFTFMRAN